MPCIVKSVEPYHVRVQ
jgi:hypothetical protein